MKLPLKINTRGKLVEENNVFAGGGIFPDLEIFSNPTIKISDVKRRRVNVIDRAVQKARREIMNQEDVEAFKALDACVESSNKDI